MAKQLFEWTMLLLSDRKWRLSLITVGDFLMGFTVGSSITPGVGVAVVLIGFAAYSIWELADINNKWGQERTHWIKIFAAGIGVVIISSVIVWGSVSKSASKELGDRDIELDRQNQVITALSDQIATLEAIPPTATPAPVPTINPDNPWSAFIVLMSPVTPSSDNQYAWVTEFGSEINVGGFDIDLRVNNIAENVRWSFGLPGRPDLAVNRTRSSGFYSGEGFEILEQRIRIGYTCPTVSDDNSFYIYFEADSPVQIIPPIEFVPRESYGGQC
jgi:hypothetical protein